MDAISFLFQMRLGFERLQALVKTRQLATSYKEMRKRIIAFQSLCRGCISRREHRLKLGAIVTLQAGFKMALARKELNRRKKEVTKYSH